MLDVGCGEGRPSLYLSHRLPEVVGIDLSPANIALARNTAAHLGLDRVRFEVGDIEHLHFPAASFDGVCFGGNVFTYRFDVGKMLREIHRVLRPGGLFAFEQWPVDPDSPPYESILWFIDGGPPIVHYSAGEGLWNRSYFIYLKPDSPQGRRIAELATRMSGLLSDEQREACEWVLGAIREGDVGMVERATFAGENRSIAADELPRLLGDAGFTDVAYWAVPDGRAFAESLRQSGVLDRLTQDDLLPYLRALVASSPRIDCWVEQVTGSPRRAIRTASTPRPHPASSTVPSWGSQRSSTIWLLCGTIQRLTGAPGSSLISSSPQQSNNPRTTSASYTIASFQDVIMDSMPASLPR